MSWQMPTQGQWPPAVAMTPDMMNVGGSYTPEQWAVMQQNWQQWAQWQQQYAQWQNQYGEKYAQQMQAMQANSAPPRPPNSAPPPAPPPPDQPPPPPHENNQPLYASAPPAAQPAPVPPPNSARTPRSNLTTVNITQGNAQSQRSHEEPKESQPAVNTEALRKLAEEEKLFDIQFQKWEEEIDKWRKENVNHPDKEAYKEYEAKFEACRAQLLERRQQMNQKRARLLSSAPTPPAGNKPPAVPPPPIKTASPYDQSQSQGYNNRQDYHNQSQSFNKKQDQSYSNPNASYQQFSEPPPTHNQQYNRANRGNIDPQDRYESYEDADNYPADDYPPDNSSFLPTSGASKNIPGLDLVPDTDKPPPPINQQDVIDITEEHPAKKQPPKGPDYTTISKGINNILGDEKIMNILSSLQGSQDTSNKNKNQNNAQNNYNNQNMPHNQWNRNDNYNQQYGNRQNNMPFNNRQDQNYPMQQNVSMQPNNSMHQHQNHPMQQNNSMNQNHPMQQNNSMNQNYPMQHNNSMNQNRPMPQNNSMDQNRSMQQNNPLIQNHPMHQNHPMQHNQNQNRYPPNQRNMYEEGQGDSYDRNSQYGGQDMPQRNDQGQRQNTSAPRPLLDLPVQAPPMNHFQRRPPNIGMAQNVPSNAPPPPPRPKWMDEPLFTPSFIVEYEHKPLRLKARDFIEPVHMFEYHHKSKDGDTIKKDFEKEVDEIFSRKPRKDRENEYPVDRVDTDRYNRDPYSRDFERRVPRDDNRDDYRRPPREDFEERRRPDDRYDDRRRDDRDKYTRRDDRDRDRDRERERERDRDFHRDRYSRDNYGRESRRDESRHRSRSRERDSRKREHSRETDSGSKKSKESAADNDKPKHVVMIDDILESPGREMRPDKIVVILRGPPGSGKSYLAKLIRDREAEYGGTARIMSIDDYFMQEGEIEEKDPTTGKTVKKPTLKYEYDEKQEETYLNSLKRAFKRSLTDGYFTFLIYDAVNEHLRTYADVWNFARQNGFQVYVCTMELDPQICYKRNIHNRKLEDIEVICSCFFATPSHHIQLDPTTLLQSAAIPDVHMEDAEDVVIMEDAQEPEVESVFTSKWERMDDAAQLAKLDGTSKPLRPSQFSMEDYLQLDDWTPNKAKPGKKTVRWADIEERRQQEKMRAIGFVVGQTDWNRMTDPTMGSSALTQTKYIERVRRT